MSANFLEIIRTVGVSLEVLTAIVGTAFYYKYSHSFLKYFLWILWLTVVIEFTAMIFRHYGLDNAILYNIYHVINFSYLLMLYSKLVTNPKHKTIIKWFLYAYILIYIINVFGQNYFIEFQTASHVLAGFFVIISVLLFLVGMLRGDKVITITQNLLFWISVGVFIKNISDIPFRIIRNLDVFQEGLKNFDALFTINLSLSLLMYIVFIIGFICSSKDYHY